MGIISRMINAFSSRSPTEYNIREAYSSRRPDRRPLSFTNAKTLMAPVINRIAVDCAQITLEHVKLDDNLRYEDTIRDSITNLFNYQANIDQSGNAFLLDIYQSLLDEGNIALAPIDYDDEPVNGAYIIESARVGKICEWGPTSVFVDAYNQITGLHERIKCKKEITPIIENPFAPIMNDYNSTLQRLNRKLSLLDQIDEQSGSNKLDIIIQLPYVITRGRQKDEAAKRKAQIEDQLVNSKYGIAYIDGSEHITQLNRPVENNIFTQIQYLSEEFLSQIGFSMSILNGTADEQTMTNYNNNILLPIVTAVVSEIRRKWITKEAVFEDKQDLMFMRDPFKLITPTQMASIADTYTRNEILSSNEIRVISGRKPSKDPKADELRNKNLNQSNDQTTDQKKDEPITERNDNQNGNEI